MFNKNKKHDEITHAKHDVLFINKKGVIKSRNDKRLTRVERVMLSEAGTS